MTEPQTQAITLADKSKRVQVLLDQRMGEIAKALPASVMTADRFARVVLTLCMRNPSLYDCRPATLLGAVMQSAQLGLSPDPVLGEAWFVPFKGEVQFIPGYKGLVKLAWQSGMLSKISARVVREGDRFDYGYGLDEKLVHLPMSGLDAPLTYVYAIAKISGSEEPMFDVMTREAVDRIKARSPSARGGRSPWTSDYDEMAKKTVLRRLCKLLPTSTDRAAPMQKAAALDERAELGLRQHNEDLLGAFSGDDAMPEEETTDDRNEEATKEK